MWQRPTVAVLGGAALSAAFEPIDLPWLLPFAVACFALATDVASPRRSALAGLIFGVCFYFPHIAWMRASIGTDAWLALAGIEAAFYGLLGLAVPLLRRLPLWPLWLAAAWTTMESLRSGWPFSGMPWGRLAFAAIDTPVAPAVAYAGMSGLSFLLALLSFCLAHTIRQGLAWRPGERLRHRDSLLGSGAATVGLLALLLTPALLPYHATQSGTARVAVVQGNVPGPGNDILYDPRGVTENHVNATVQLAADVSAGDAPQPDFVVWPENSTATDPFSDLPVHQGIVEATSAIGVPVLVGGIVDQGDKYVLNQGIVWDPVTGPGERYTKHHPVPYGEYIPYRDLWEPQFGRLAEITRNMRSGTSTQPITIAGVEVADAICFDVAYDDVMPAQVRAGAQMLVVQTSNASFINTFQIEQQFAITRLRAIEAGRWLTVASTNGRTGVIDPDGAVVAAAGIKTTEVLSEQVGLSSDLTPAMRLGPWPSRVLTVLTLLALAAGVITYRRGVSKDRLAAASLTDQALEQADA
ncbi:MAG: apolipoprotein N-acyltransferase [Nocardioidaceae bacterium]|nr:apolipoprotein N-acyltransferase [Nocardioidaceae bacterium]